VKLKKFARRLLLTALGIAALLAIVLLGYNTWHNLDTLNMLAAQHALQLQQSTQFPVIGTQIALDNATVSAAQTTAPTATIAPTDAPIDASASPSPVAIIHQAGTHNGQPVLYNGAAQRDQQGTPPTNTPASTGGPLVVTNTPAVTPTDVPVTDVVATAAPTMGKLPAVRLLIPPTINGPEPTGVPSPFPRLQTKDDIVNIALLGSDYDGNDAPADQSFRTDSLIVVSIDRTTNTVSMISLPRDFYGYIPTVGMQRVNIAFAYGQAEGYQPGGGFGLMQQTILYNFGIPINFYAKVSFNGFKQIVDSLNGIDVAVDCPVKDLRYQGAQDGHTPTPNEYTMFTLEAGFYHMNGSLALWYSRMRDASSDFDRSRRQQQVLRGILKTARSQGLILKAPDLWGQLTQIVTTNMTLGDMLSLAPIGLNLSPESISSYYMYKGIELQHWATPKGEDVQLPIANNLAYTLQRFYTPPSKNQLAATRLSIAVFNGSGHADYDKVATDRLAWGGFAGVAQGTTDVTGSTVVYDYTGGAQPALLAGLLKALNVKASVVVSQPDPNRTSDFKVVLGADYNTCSAPGYNK